MRRLIAVFSVIVFLLLTFALAYDSTFTFSKTEMEDMLSRLEYPGQSIEDDLAVLESVVGNNKAASQALDNLRRYSGSVNAAWEAVSIKYYSNDKRATITFVLNTNTKKFHLPDCKYVATIKESNRVDYTGSRDEVIGKGYDPCGWCHP